MIDSHSNEYDVTIAGAGPAGSSLAIRLAIAGLRVLLVEQKKFPREKLCGEFVSPESLEHFVELGIVPAISAAHGIEILTTVFYARSGRSLTIPSSWFRGNGQPALGLSRAELDVTLLDRAKEVGVDVREETTISELLIENGVVRGASLQGKDNTQRDVRSTLTIDATGRTRALTRLIRKEKRSQASHVAFKTHLDGVEIENNACEIYSYAGGYGGCNFVENGFANVCFIVNAADARALGSDPERAFRERLMTNIRANSALEHSSAIKPWLAVPIDRYGRGDLIPTVGLLSIGDAAGFIDPFTGSGILLALESSRAAADAIGSNFAENMNLAKLGTDYSQAYSRSIDSRLRFSSILRTFAYRPFLASAVVAAFSISPRLSRNIALATRNG